MLFQGISHTGHALLDSGAEGNFFDAAMTQKWRIPAIPLAEPIEAWSLAGSRLTTVTHVTPSVQPADLTGVPVEYHDLSMVFSKSRATSLPPHRSYDCAINLLPGTSPPKGRLYSLSGTEREAMDKYIQEALLAGLIRRSSSPAGAGFFFVQKKDGSLRPCIDYRGLNDITIKNRYPLPLMSSAFELLQGARVFTKLDLRNAYHLVCIREGDEWKTAFNTPTGHFEYRVLPFGLTNAPAVFQDLVNRVLGSRALCTLIRFFLRDLFGRITTHPRRGREGILIPVVVARNISRTLPSWWVHGTFQGLFLRGGCTEHFKDSSFVVVARNFSRTLPSWWLHGTFQGLFLRGGCTEHFKASLFGVVAQNISRTLTSGSCTEHFKDSLQGCCTERASTLPLGFWQRTLYGLTRTQPIKTLELFRSRLTSSPITSWPSARSLSHIYQCWCYLSLCVFAAIALNKPFDSCPYYPA
ncbi:uncharacterized protein LOC130555915 [Triplophysa rosa]|uniref:uncharacterized protein LOC130555915 n=1 Tax=Triplophysa rosa TaxID=992332 RepID=UPI002545E973|nr:uncharacterized protein LOC130555915 [Triplophysa rosa]